jgi:tetratricopeptide (TPR) repeat protein
MSDRDNNKALTLSRLGRTYHVLYREERGRADLDKAISLHEEAMQFTGPFHPQLAKHEHDLGSALLDRFRQSKDPVDLEGAISHCENALKFTEDRNEDKPNHLSELGIAHGLRFKHFGDPADLEKSISCQQQAVELTPSGHPNKPTMLNNQMCFNSGLSALVTSQT